MASLMRNEMRPLPLPAADIVAAIGHTALNLANAGLASECWSDWKKAGFNAPSNVIAPRGQSPGESSRDLMPYIGSVLAGRMAGEGRSCAHPPSRCTAGILSGREGEILGLLGNGLSTKRIALALGIAPETVKSHVKRIFLKLEVRTRAEAVSRATALYLMRRGEERVPHSRAIYDSSSAPA